MPEPFFNKVAGLEAWSFIKNKTLAQVCSCEFCNIYQTTFFIEHLRWLLLSYADQEIKTEGAIDSTQLWSFVCIHCTSNHSPMLSFIKAHHTKPLATRSKTFFKSVIFLQNIFPLNVSSLANSISRQLHFVTFICCLIKFSTNLLINFESIELVPRTFRKLIVSIVTGKCH